MAYNYNEKQRIFNRTGGYCHLCHKKLSFSNYALPFERGAWHVDHDVPKANGGSNSLRNLYPACISCNLEKGATPTHIIRRSNGVTRAPFSKARIEKIRDRNQAVGAVGGAALGSLFGPLGAIAGMLFGIVVGDSETPQK